MKSTDKLLLGIVLGVVLLIVIVFSVMLLKPKPSFQSEDTPDGVAHNYLLALQQEDYDRAYSYLSTSLPGYPDNAEAFRQNVADYSWRFRLGQEVTLAIESAETLNSRAVVTVLETRFYQSGAFEGSQRISTFEIDLELDGNQWKIVDSDSYFAWCWDDEDGCRQ